MRKFSSIYQFFSLLSVDVALGVVAQHLLIAKLLEIEISIFILYALFSSTIFIYSIDHLIDIINRPHLFTQKYIFYKKHKKIIYAVIICSGVASFLLAFCLTSFVFYIGVILVFIMGIYFFFIIRKKQVFHYFQREKIIALVYSFALFLPLLEDIFLYEKRLLTFALYVYSYILIYVSVLLFSLIDFENDKKEGHISMVCIKGYAKGKQSFYHYLIFFSFFLLSFFYLFPWHFALLCYCMGGVVFLIYKKKKRIATNFLYRYCIEANLFLLPLLYLWVYR